MKKNILVSAITFMFLLTESGDFWGTVEKKTESPPLGNIQQECSEDNQETSSCSAESSPLFDTSENKVSISIPKSEVESKEVKGEDRLLRPRKIEVK
jgi:hypothetical protein